MATTGSTTTGNKDFYDYIQSLVDRLKIAEEEQNRKLIKYNDIKTLKNRTQMKVDFLRECFDRIVETNRLAKNVIYTITKNQRLVRRTACNAELFRKATMVLVCMNENIAIKILELKLCTESLIEAIENSNCTPDANGDFMRKLNALQMAITTAFTTSCNCITKALESLQRAMIVEHYIGDEDCTLGFTGALLNMLKVIHIHYDRDSQVRFPRSDKSKGFYHKVHKVLNHTEEELEELMQKLERAEEEKILIDAEVNSIRSSKDAAQMAGTC